MCHHDEQHVSVPRLIGPGFNSLYGVVVTSGEKVVGMGRIVGDGAIFFYIQDIAVEPAHQRRGVGIKILDKLMEYLRDSAPEKAFIGLFAAKGSTPFYENYGFRNWTPNITGMFLVTPVQPRHREGESTCQIIPTLRRR